MGVVVVRGHPGCLSPGFPLLYFHFVMVKQILLLALKSSRTAVGGSAVTGGGSVVKDRFEAAGSFGSGGGSLDLGHRQWVCHPGLRDR